MTALRSLAALTPLAPNASVAPDMVVLESRGAVLVVGDGPAIAAAVGALAAQMKVVAFAPGFGDFKSGGAKVMAVGGRVVSISGMLGAFRARAAIPGGASADIGKFSPNADGSFDLVLDLCGKPLLAGSVAPPGYFAPRGDQEAVTEAVTAVRRLVGRFAKPRYVGYDASLCTHGAKGLRGCTRCLSVCPAGALRSAGDLIALDAGLCQGCANCALACPTGALSFNRPSRAALRASLRRMIETAASEGNAAPVIVVHVPAAGVATEAAPRPVRVLHLEALPAFGEELWFEALALGAAGVVMVRNARATMEERKLFDRMIAEARVLLGAKGVSQTRLVLVESDALAAAIDAVPQQACRLNDAGEPPMVPADAAKRPALLASLDALHDGPDDALAQLALASGMPFGKVLVDRAKCTLCFACANLCPVAAFAAELKPVPILRFIEEKCVQCGLCGVGCPEHAITLHPCFTIDAAVRNEALVLHQDELLSCSECGTPFISRQLLASSLERIKGHPALGETGVALLRTCPACRQRNTMMG